jgi:hypothetical protein
MRRTLFAALASAALLSLVPAIALARHHGRRHHSSHARHVRVHHKRFGRDDVKPGSPTNPRSPTSESNAGTVASFTGGVLTIKLNDNSTVSATVTNATEIECESTAPSGSTGEMRADEQGSGGDETGDHRGDGDQGDNNGDNGDVGENEGSCGPAALTMGATVHEAEMNVSGAGAVWTKVELATP